MKTQMLMKIDRRGGKGGGVKDKAVPFCSYRALNLKYFQSVVISVWNMCFGRDEQQVQVTKIKNMIMVEVFEKF